MFYEKGSNKERNLYGKTHFLGKACTDYDM